MVEVFIFMNADFLQSGRITNKKGDLKVVMCHKKDEAFGKGRGRPINYVDLIKHCKMSSALTFIIF